MGIDCGARVPRRESQVEDVEDEQECYSQSEQTDEDRKVRLTEKDGPNNQEWIAH